jgi:hypothetical protein
MRDMRNAYKFSLETKGRDHSNDIDLKIILEWFLERWCGMMWTGLFWLRIGTGGGLL